MVRQRTKAKTFPYHSSRLRLPSTGCANDPRDKPIVERPTYMLRLHDPQHQTKLRRGTAFLARHVPDRTTDNDRATVSSAAGPRAPRRHLPLCGCFGTRAWRLDVQGCLECVGQSLPVQCLQIGSVSPSRSEQGLV